MTIKRVKIITDNPDYLPKLATEGSCGYDLHATDIEVDQHHRVVKYSTGVKIQLPAGYAGLLLPRSSIYKQGGWVMANSIGLIDVDYTGEIKAVFRPTFDDWTSDDMPYELGDRICQLMIVPYTKVEWEAVTEFPKKTARGEGGFGSTGRGKKKK